MSKPNLNCPDCVRLREYCGHEEKERVFRKRFQVFTRHTVKELRSILKNKGVKTSKMNKEALWKAYYHFLYQFYNKGATR